MASRNSVTSASMSSSWGRKVNRYPCFNLESRKDLDRNLGKPEPQRRIVSVKAIAQAILLLLLAFVGHLDIDRRYGLSARYPMEYFQHPVAAEAVSVEYDAGISEDR